MFLVFKFLNLNINTTKIGTINNTIYTFTQLITTDALKSHNFRKNVHIYLWDKDQVLEIMGILNLGNLSKTLNHQVTYYLFDS